MTTTATRSEINQALAEAKLYQHYSNARADYDRMPSAVNAREISRWALRLARVSDEYDDLLDEARDIMAGIIG